MRCGSFRHVARRVEAADFAGALGEMPLLLRRKNFTGRSADRRVAGHADTFAGSSRGELRGFSETLGRGHSRPLSLEGRIAPNRHRVGFGVGRLRVAGRER